MSDEQRESMQRLRQARRWLLSPGNERSAVGGMLGIIVLCVMLLAYPLS